MKSSKIVIETDNKKESFNILLKIEDNEEEYIIYTKGEKNDCGDTIAYAATYEVEDGQQVLKPIIRDDILEYLDSILIHIQNSIEKKESDKE